MSTVGKDLWFQLLRDDGRYSDDPIPLSLWTYIHQGDKLAYKVCYNDAAEVSFLDSSYVRNPELAWDDGEVTPYGMDLREIEKRDEEARRTEEDAQP